jgi:hypothetical protein
MRSRSQTGLFTETVGVATFAGLPLGRLGVPAPLTMRGDNRGGQDRLYAMPGRTGDLWLAPFDGCCRNCVPDGGSAVFVRLPGADEIHAFGFGKAAPNQPHPAPSTWLEPFAVSPASSAQSMRCAPG